MTRSKRSAFVDYQQYAHEFNLGDMVYPFDSGNKFLRGRVVAIYPAIGMVDVQWPHGNERKPVEELLRYDPEGWTQTIPGGGTESLAKERSVHKVVNAYVKQAVYWAAADRKYRAAQVELTNGQYKCPKCPDGILVKTTYKRRDRKSVRLLGCPLCMFLIKEQDIMGHPEYVDYIEPDDLDIELTSSKSRKGGK